MSKKPHKAEEPATPYPTKKTVKAGPAVNAPVSDKVIRYIDPEKARELTKKILDKHSDLFRRLAQ